MNILILGKGQFSQAMQSFFTGRGHQVTVAEGVDIRVPDQVTAAIEAGKFDWVVNAAAKTNLDWCEQNPLECFDVNTLGADRVGQVCGKLGVPLLHISTGCMQQSKTAADVHPENDPPTPTSFYSWTKYWADQMLSLRAARGELQLLIMRPRQPVSAVASPRNALLKMLTYSKFIDTPNSVTVIEDFLEVAEDMMQKGTRGTFNVCNPGVTSPYQMALLLKELVEPNLVVEKISKEELNKMTFAERIDSVLDTTKLESAGYHLKPIDVRLRELLPELKASVTAHHEILEATNKETIAKLAIKNS